MLRINLLPPYIYDKQKKIKWIVGSLALIPITGVLLFLWAQSAQAALDEANRRKTEAQTQQDQYNKYVQDIKHEEDTVAATKAKQEFVSNAIKYNAAWPQVYSQMRDLTSNKVLLHTMAVSDDRTAMNFSGWCQYEEDLVRWWMFLRQQQDVYSDVHFRLPEHPWPPKEEQGGNGPGGLAGGSFGGSSGPRGGAGMMSGAGAPTMAGMGGSSGMASSGGFGGSAGGGSFGGGGGGSDAIGPEEIEGKQGIRFTAVATLKKPLAGGIATPTWVTAAPSGGGGGAGGFGPMGGSGGPGAGFGMVSPPGGKGKMGGF